MLNPGDRVVAIAQPRPGEVIFLGRGVIEGLFRNFLDSGQPDIRIRLDDGKTCWANECDITPESSYDNRVAKIAKRIEHQTITEFRKRTRGCKA